MKRIKPFIFKCECVAGKYEKAKLEIYNMGGGDFELNGIFLFKKSVKKLIKILSKK